VIKGLFYECCLECLLECSTHTQYFDHECHIWSYFDFLLDYVASKYQSNKHPINVYLCTLANSLCMLALKWADVSISLLSHRYSNNMF
jgi:hypothetical protein